MGLIRCTCVYRLSTRIELDEGATAIVVRMLDPWCPAAYLHERVAAEAASPDHPLRH